MRIPFRSQYTILLLVFMLTPIMSLNSLSRFSRSLSFYRNGRLCGSYLFINNKNGLNDFYIYSKNENLNKLNTFPNYNSSYNTVSTTYPTTYNTPATGVPSFNQVPSFNYTVVPNQFGFQATPNNGYNSYGYNRLNRPRTFNRNYQRSYNPNFQRTYKRFSSEMPINTIDWDNEKLVEIKKDFYDLSYEADSRPGEEIEKILKSHSIVIEGEHPLPKPVNTFDEAVFNEPIQKIIKELKFKEPTPIQKVGWTSCLTGRDVVGISQTGSGKTLTFLLPGILHLMAQPPVGTGGPIMLILAPTRELCQQISDEALPYSRMLNLRLATLYGGSSRYTQVKSCENGVEIMVATPGRLLDLLSNGDVKLNRVSYFVMDEADRMLDMGFEPQIRKIVSQIRPDRQTLMFSATWPSDIRVLASEFCKPDFIYIQIGDLELTANPNITQNVQVMNSYDIRESLFNFLDNLGPTKKVLIFSDLKSFCDQLTRNLQQRKFKAFSLHGDMSQFQRERTLRMYRDGDFNILVATDVASRGLDVKDIDYVINLDAPKSLLNYIHRIGRTARGGNKGESLLYFAKDNLTPMKIKFAKDLTDLLNKLNQNVPSELLQFVNNY